MLKHQTTSSVREAESLKEFLFQSSVKNQVIKCIYYINSKKERKQSHIRASFLQGINCDFKKNTFLKNSSFFHEKEKVLSYNFRLYMDILAQRFKFVLDKDSWFTAQGKKIIILIFISVLGVSMKLLFIKSASSLLNCAGTHSRHWV